VVNFGSTADKRYAPASELPLTYETHECAQAPAESKRDWADFPGVKNLCDSDVDHYLEAFPKDRWPDIDSIERSITMRWRPGKVGKEQAKKQAEGQG
jgi:hypothetical protein